MAFAKGVKEFNNEVKFLVGERVHIELKEIPIKERNITTGIIVGIDTRFMHTPELRSITYAIRMDGEYVKKQYQLFGGIGEVSRFSCDQLKKLNTV